MLAALGRGYAVCRPTGSLGEVAGLVGDGKDPECPLPQQGAGHNASEAELHLMCLLKRHHMLILVASPFHRSTDPDSSETPGLGSVMVSSEM